MKHSMVTLWDITQQRRMNEFQVHGAAGAKLTNVRQEEAKHGAANIRGVSQFKQGSGFHKTQKGDYAGDGALAWGCSGAGGRVLGAEGLLPVWVLLLWSLPYNC